ncbi:RNA polymerase sigma factor [Patulibacter minatonensis]|uniref:RNA polymerase sigma factor n=1 Tax=Patulibacter minatonensis TaxID=298163 RepID=UPI00047D3F41|nr:sigma-70 family RNA polymerase sigma factor [Patulibacter minatonensis]
MKRRSRASREHPPAVAGDPAAFAALYERHRTELFRYCRSILRHEQDAHDALQNTMVKAFAALQTEDRDLDLRPWLFRIAHNEAISLIRRRPETAELDDRVGGDDDTVHRTVETRERLGHLRADLQDLPERQRGALVMRELSGLSHEEIGVALGTSARAVKQTIYEARKGLGDAAEGRAMDCDTVQRTLSDDDGRVVGTRRMRAHLRSCRSCRTFQGALAQRPKDLAALSPVVPLAGAAGLAALLKGGAAGGGIAGGAGAGVAGTAGAGVSGGVGATAGVGGGLALAGATKIVAVVAATTALAGGAVAVDHVVSHDPPGPARSAPPGAGANRSPAGPGGTVRSPAIPGTATGARTPADARGVAATRRGREAGNRSTTGASGAPGAGSASTAPPGDRGGRADAASTADAKTAKAEAKAEAKAKKADAKTAKSNAKATAAKAEAAKSKPAKSEAAKAKSAKAEAASAAKAEAAKRKDAKGSGSSTGGTSDSGRSSATTSSKPSTTTTTSASPPARTTPGGSSTSTKPSNSGKGD